MKSGGAKPDLWEQSNMMRFKHLLQHMKLNRATYRTPGRLDTLKNIHSNVQNTFAYKSQRTLKYQMFIKY